MGRRRDQALRDDALVIRYGLMEIAHLHVAALRCNEARGFPGLSFFGENDLTVDEIAAAAPRPHAWVRVSTHGRMRSAGFHLRRDGRCNHLVLPFAAPPSTDELKRLVDVFDPPIANPHAV